MGIFGPVHGWLGDSVVSSRRHEHLAGFPSGTFIRKGEHTKTHVSLGWLQKPGPRVRANCIKQQGLLFGLNWSICVCKVLSPAAAAPRNRDRVVHRRTGRLSRNGAAVRVFDQSDDGRSDPIQCRRPTTQ
jgi:hypothetical protein